MARKLPQLQRALDAPALASVAYGEIASSIYFALGIIALHALGLTPVVLGIVGLLFIIVALSYAEGTASIRETGGAATFVRVAFNDFAGFLTGIALSALFFPHYLGLALGIHVIARHPGDVITGCILIGIIALSRLARRTKLYTFGIVVPLLDLVTQILLVVLGFAILFSGSALTRGMSLGTSPSWHQIAFAVDRALNRLASFDADVCRLRAPAACGSLVRKRAARLRRAHRRTRPLRGRDDLRVRLQPARVLAGRARPAAARVRAPAPAHPRVAGGGGGRDRNRHRLPDRDVVSEARGHLPCQPVQLR